MICDAVHLEAEAGPVPAQEVVVGLPRGVVCFHPWAVRGRRVVVVVQHVVEVAVAVARVVHEHLQLIRRPRVRLCWWLLSKRRQATRRLSWH